jgi:Secretion system C-terminal sorting domain
MRSTQHILPLTILALISLVTYQLKTEPIEIAPTEIDETTTLSVAKPQPQLVWDIPEEAPEPFEVEPIEIFYDTKEIDTLLPLISIAIDDYRPCGCQPAPLPLIKIPVDTSQYDDDYSIFAEPIYAEPDRFDAIVYPNPTRGESTLALDIETEGQYQIFMYDLNGRKIRDIHSGELFIGRNNFNIDLFDLQSGMYFLQVLAEGQNETLKIQKL